MSENQELEPKNTEGRVSSLSNCSTGSNSSRNSTIRELLQSKESKELVDEIDDKISHLIDIIKSRKYTGKRKKYYAKKIVDKIIDKYTDDTVDTLNFGLQSFPTSTPFDTDKENKSDRIKNLEICEEMIRSSKVSPAGTLSNIKEIEIDKKTNILDVKSQDAGETPKTAASEDIPKELSLTSVCGNAARDMEVLTKVKILQKELKDIEIPKAPFSPHHVEKTAEEAKNEFSKLELKVSEVKESLTDTKQTDRSKSPVSDRYKSKSLKYFQNDSPKTIQETCQVQKSNSEPKSKPESTSTKYIDLIKKDKNYDEFKTIRDLTPRTLCEIYKVEFSDSSSQKNSSSEDKLDSHSVTQKDWKFYKTTSEKVFENRKTKKDFVLKYAQKEKDRQIAWINNEIECLTKLKNILEQSCSIEISESSPSINSNSHDGNKTLEEINSCLDELKKILNEKKKKESRSTSIIETPIQEIKYDLKQSSSSNESYKKLHKPTEFELKYFLSSDNSNKENSDSNNFEIQKRNVEIQTSPKTSEDSLQISVNFKKETDKNLEKSRSLAYFLTFEEQNGFNNNLNKGKKLEKVTVKIPRIRKHNPNTEYTDLELQEYLLKNRSDFVKAAEWRRQCINDLIFMRDKRYNEIDKRLLFTTQEMRNITNKKYKETEEVKNKLKTKKNQLHKVFNRQLASVFSKKLQEKTLKGEVTISTRKTVVYS